MGARTAGRSDGSLSLKRLAVDLLLLVAAGLFNVGLVIGLVGAVVLAALVAVFA